MTDDETPVLRLQDGSMIVLTLNAPTRRNALSTAMRTALLAALQEAQDDPSCRCIVLTGMGGNFCSGGDIGEMTAPEGVTPGEYARYRIGLLQDIVRLVVGGAKPVIAVVAGHAAGAGMSMACACEYLIAEPDARFAASFARLGLIADCGLTWSLPRRVGAARAQDLLTTGRSVGAEEAVRLDLVDELAGSGEGMAAAARRAALYAQAAPLGIAAARRVLLHPPVDVESALAAESAEQATLRISGDHREARRAFAEKRPPVFSGS